MNDYLSIGEASRYIGCSISTLRRMEEDGRLKSHYRTFGRHRRYCVNDLNTLLGKHREDDRKVVAYARVSTHKQKNDLKLQEKRVSAYCDEHYDSYELISDLGSGLNYKKRGLVKLIKMILSRQMKVLVLNYKDRLLRFGSEIIFSLCHYFKVEVVILNQDKNATFEEEFAKDVLEVLTVFSAKLYGSRSRDHHKTKKSSENKGLS